MEKLWWEIFIWFFLAFVSSITAFITNISSSLIELLVGIVAGNTIKPEITRMDKLFSDSWSCNFNILGRC